MWFRQNARRRTARLWCRALENRVVPTVNLILDFDGGTLQQNAGYTVDTNWTGIALAPFGGYDVQSFDGKFDRTEQVLQIVSGVRMDYADFDVNVVWDDRGVASPLYTTGSQVIMVIDNFDSDVGVSGALGITAVSGNPSARNVGLVFEKNHEDSFFSTTRRMRETIDTTSHEAGHAFRLSHSVQSDPEERQLVTVAFQNGDLDSRFSSTALPTDNGDFYAERNRLFSNVGAAKVGKNLGSNELFTNQTLPFDTPVISLDTQDVGLFTTTIPYGSTTVPLSIEYAGDRDSFQVFLESGKTYAIRERAAGSSIDPILSIWNSEGDWIATGSQGAVGGVSLLNFTPTLSGFFFIVAGTGFDRGLSQSTKTASRGTYHLEITPTWLEVNTVSQAVIVSGSTAADTFEAHIAGSDLSVTRNALSILIPNTFATAVQFAGIGGDDTYTIDFSTGLFDASINDAIGNDRLTVNGTPAADIFAISPMLISRTGGGKITLSGIDTVTINGGEGNDSFQVTPGKQSIVVHGGNPPSPITPGDTLSIVASDGIRVPQNPSDGQYVFPTAQPVIYTGIETFEDVIVPPPPGPQQPKTSFAIGVGAGAIPVVDFYREGRSSPTYSVTAYDPGFRGGVRVATADVDGDGYADLITGAGPRGGPHVQVFSGLGPFPIDGPISSFFAYDASFTGGVWVAAGDVTGDGRADIITGADAGGGSHVRIFDGVTRDIVREFFAFIPEFRGGVRVAAGDITGDSLADIVCAAGPGGGPHVIVYDGKTGQVALQYFAYEATFRGGVFVSAGDVTGDGRADVVTGAGEGGGPIITIRNGATGELLSRVNAYASAASSSLFTGDSQWASGLRVALADTDLDGELELYVSPGRGKTGQVKGISLSTITDIWVRSPGDPTFLGGIFVGS
ncbi:MAG: VCBS repeat-containing protein [Gemmataceae bacterium]|nr:VCBS repeat-containing protein [Gemmataceae bacterium]